MTAFATPRVTTRTAKPASGRFGESLESFRGSMREWGQAFKASGRMADRNDLDYRAMLLFGRD
jgi:hypothetical protein